MPGRDLTYNSPGAAPTLPLLTIENKNNDIIMNISDVHKLILDITSFIERMSRWSLHDIARFSSIRNHTEVYQFDQQSNNQTTMRVYPICSDSHYQHYVDVQPSAQAIDIRPVVHNDHLLAIYPALVLPTTANIETVAHEICHIVSFGGYHMDHRGVIVHKRGCIAERLIIKSGSLLCVQCRGNVQHNEHMTDLCSIYVLQNITNTAISRKGSTEYMKFYSEFELWLKKRGIDERCAIHSFFRDVYS